MRNYYYENVAVEESRLVDCLNALCRLEERPFARLLTRAIQEAHTKSVPPVAPDVFWKNLFVGERPLVTPNKDRDPQTVPAAPYEYLDAQDAVKYLSDIGRNRKAADGTPITDSLVVLNYFHIADKSEQLRAYNDALRKLMGDRNDWIGHVIEARDKKAGMKDATQYRDLLLQAVEPLCNTQWSGQRRSIALRERILQEFYDNLGPLKYTLESIMRYAHIHLGKQEQVEELLQAAGFAVQDGKVTLEINPTIFADELAQVVLRTDLSLESRARQLKLRLPGGEIIMNEMLLQETDGDLRHISQRALEELLEQGEADAQCEMGWRWVEKETGDYDENCRKAAPWFEKAAKQGHPQAMRVLGNWLHRGRYVKQDQRKGLLLLKMAVDAGELKAHRLLGLIYEGGEGTEKDPQRAYRLYEAGAQLGSSVCQLEQARCLLKGIGVTKNEEEAVYLYQKLDYQDVPEASWALAEYYQDSKTEGGYYLHYLQRAVDRKVPAAMRTMAYRLFGGDQRELMKAAAQGGDPEAQWWCGQNCAYNDKHQEAFSWFLRAAKNGYAPSYLAVGECYLHGKGTPVDKNAGRQWLHKAEHTDYESETWHELGLSYLKESDYAQKEKGIAYLEKSSGMSPVEAAMFFANGFCNNKDTKTALFLYGRAGMLGEPKGYLEAARLCEKEGKEKAAINGYCLSANAFPEAAYKAAMLLVKSNGDSKEIQKQLLSAADRGYAPAQFELFKVYSKGLYETQEDWEKAMQWLRQAADQGDAKACHQLGNLYAVGRCVPKDIALAADWLEKALKTPGYENAERVKQQLDTIRKS